MTSDLVELHVLSFGHINGKRLVISQVSQISDSWRFVSLTQLLALWHLHYQKPSGQRPHVTRSAPDEVITIESL